jgi:iron complex transport system substrate-binding protein
LLPAGCGSGGESGDGASSGETIRVEHAGGVTEVPQGVERIAALDGYPDLHSLLALGVVPEIAAIKEQKDSPVVGDRLDEVEVTVERGQPNLETLAAAGPGLIFGVEYILDEGLYEKLSEIAPTVILHRYESNVDGHLRTVARALGRPGEAERVISEFEDRLEEVASVVRDSRLADVPFAVVMQYAYEGTFRVLGKNSYCGRTLEAVGLSCGI